MASEEKAALMARLEQMKTEHRDLDEVIGRLSADGHPNFLQLQRLKKRKLKLKDEITHIEDVLLPDIIA